MEGKWAKLAEQKFHFEMDSRNKELELKKMEIEKEEKLKKLEMEKDERLVKKIVTKLSQIIGQQLDCNQR